MSDMSTLMPRYEAYKDSGVDWIGEIPAHWELLHNRYIFRLKKKLVGKRFDEYELLSLTLKGIIKRDMDNPEGKFPTEFDAYQEVSPGDFVFCLFDVEETPRAVGLSNYHGMITGAYTVFTLHEKYDSLFLYYFYLNLDSHKMMKPLYKGLRNTIPKDHFFDFKTLIPPFHEQTLIAIFLECKTKKINQTIAIKEKQINLLKERKQILIQNAVTKGLDPDVPMRDSGVEWVGEISRHWKIVANRTLFKERVEPGQEGLPLLSVSIHSGISNDEISEEENIRGRVRIEDKTKYSLVKPDDIVFNMMRAWQGAVGSARVNGMVSPAYIIAEPIGDIYTPYFEYQYRCPIFIQQMDRFSKGITDFRKRLYWHEFKQLLTVLPPIDEQKAIVTHIQTQSTKIDKAITIQEQMIEKLKEYKATLINSAVTGKIKVPEVETQKAVA